MYIYCCADVYLILLYLMDISIVKQQFRPSA